MISSPIPITQKEETKLTLKKWYKKLPQNSECSRLIQKWLTREDIPVSTHVFLEHLFTMIDPTYSDPLIFSLISLMVYDYTYGNVCLRVSLPHLKEKLALIWDSHEEAVAQRIIHAIQGGQWKEWIGEEKRYENYPIVLVKRGTEQYLYFQRCYYYARKYHEMLKSFLESPLKWLLPLDQLQPIFSRVITSSAYTLNAHQLLAILLTLMNRLTIISGGPGTGKTSIVLFILKLFLECGGDLEQVRLVAPTGRAASRMVESIRNQTSNLTIDQGVFQNLESYTIHRLLQYSPYTHSFLYNEYCKLPVQLVIVDEVSMVDVELMGAMMMALPSDARMVLLGDKNQLPAIRPGSIFTELIPEEQLGFYPPNCVQNIKNFLKGLSLPQKDEIITILNHHQGQTDLFSAPFASSTVILKKSYRSEKQILEIAHWINQMDYDALKNLLWEKNLKIFPQRLSSGNGVSLFYADVSSPVVMNWSLQEWYRWRFEEFKDPHLNMTWIELIQNLTQEIVDWNMGSSWMVKVNGLLNMINIGQILTVQHLGHYGTEHINSFIASRFTLVTPFQLRKDIFHGAIILITQNDHNLQLYNGEIGILLNAKEEGWVAVFPGGDTVRKFSIDTLPSYELGFAITVHKSQGSEYETLLFYLPPTQDHWLLSKEVIYTGITRAKKHAIVWGTPEILLAGSIRSIKRETGPFLWDYPSQNPIQIRK